MAEVAIKLTRSSFYDRGTVAVFTEYVIVRAVFDQPRNELGRQPLVFVPVWWQTGPS